MYFVEVFLQLENFPRFFAHQPLNEELLAHRHGYSGALRICKISSDTQTPVALNHAAC